MGAQTLNATKALLQPNTCAFSSPAPNHPTWHQQHDGDESCQETLHHCLANDITLKATTVRYLTNQAAPHKSKQTEAMLCYKVNIHQAPSLLSRKILHRAQK